MYFYVFGALVNDRKKDMFIVLYFNVTSLWFLLCVAFILLLMYFYVIGAVVNGRQKDILIFLGIVTLFHCDLCNV